MVSAIRDKTEYMTTIIAQHYEESGLLDGLREMCISVRLNMYSRPYRAWLHAIKETLGRATLKLSRLRMDRMHSVSIERNQSVQFCPGVATGREAWRGRGEGRACSRDSLGVCVAEPLVGGEGGGRGEAEGLAGGVARGERAQVRLLLPLVRVPRAL